MSHSAISSEAEGSRSDGFRMKALPQASATGNIHRGLEQAVIQSTEIGAVNSWLRNQPEEVVSAAVASLREELEPYADGTSVRLPGAM